MKYKGHLKSYLVAATFGAVTLASGAMVLNHTTSLSQAEPISQSQVITAKQSYIVKGTTADAARAAIAAVGGTVTHELGIIKSLGADLTGSQADAVRQAEGIASVFADNTVEVAGGKPALETFYPSLVGADLLHEQGNTGDGIGVAVIDSGSKSHLALNKDSDGWWRQVAQYEAITDTVLGSLPVAELTSTSGMGTYTNDENGHGTHVSSIALSSASTGRRNPKFAGVAPDSYLVSVKAFDVDGSSSYADVISGIDWIVANKDVYNIRVLNLSFSATPRSHYWDDPLNQAVMAAWQAGIVVLASAGNGGPDPMTIGVPGNVPYVITVGAMTDNYTPADGSDDVLASFSAAGPTYVGFVKPEVVAPGGHMLGLMNNMMQIAQDHPEFHDGANYFEMSGTSQSAAVVTGAVALLLDAKPWLTPDDVKCQLMASARPAVDNGQLAYSIFQQGTGMINAYDAVQSDELACANRGLDVQADLEGTAHFGGLANQDANGDYHIMGVDGYLWDDGLTETASVNHWVNQE